MSLPQEPIGEIPTQTAEVARAIYPHGNRYLRLRDELGTVWTNQDFAELFSFTGQPALAPWRLALVCLFQFTESLSDRQAADAVRARIDWKYALGLPLTDCGFDASVLSEFRARLLAHDRTDFLLDRMISVFSKQGLITARGTQRTDSTHVLASIRTLNRLEMAGESLRAALEAVAEQAPEWLQSWIPLDWYQRYGRRIETSRVPQSEAEREQEARLMGEDGWKLYQTIRQSAQSVWLARLPELEHLRQYWVQTYIWEQGHLQCRNKDDLPPGHLRSCSPYDPQARWSQKRETTWVGYKVHLSETCEEQGPHFITHVRTRQATESDLQAILPIQQALQDKGLKPIRHLVDSGYLDLQRLVQSAKQDIELYGPLSHEQSWQTRAGEGYGQDAFVLDWQNQQATCPQGQRSRSWREHQRHGKKSLTIRFGQASCQGCPVRAHCTRDQHSGRQLSVTDPDLLVHKQAARARQESESFAEIYQQRAGIEGTISQGVRVTGMRRSRYRGLDKTHQQQVFSALAINLLRYDAWQEKAPRAHTRTSRLRRLAPQALLG